MLPDNNYNENSAISKSDNENAAGDSNRNSDMIEKESMPDMLDVIWEADDLGIQGGFMYYYPESTDKK